MRTNEFMCSRMMMRESERTQKPDAKGISRSGYLPLNEKQLTTSREGTLYMENPTTHRFEKVGQRQ